MKTDKQYSGAIVFNLKIVEKRAVKTLQSASQIGFTSYNSTRE